MRTRAMWAMLAGGVVSSGAALGGWAVEEPSAVGFAVASVVLFFGSLGLSGEEA